MKRIAFNKISIATITSLLLPAFFTKAADALPLQNTVLGASQRFPGFTLRAYRDLAGEVYLSFNKEKLATEIGHSVDEVEAVHPDELITNANYVGFAEKCNGHCAKRGIPDYESGGHDCFIVSDAIATYLTDIDKQDHSKKFDPTTIGIVDQIWTSYN